MLAPVPPARRKRANDLEAPTIVTAPTPGQAVPKRALGRALSWPLMRLRPLTALFLMLAVSAAGAADSGVIEDWTRIPVGTRGIPEGWKGQSWGSPAYDFTVVDVDGRRALWLKSRGDSSTITKDIKGR